MLVKVIKIVGGRRVLCAQYRLLWLKRCCERYVGNPVIYPLI